MDNASEGKEGTGVFSGPKTIGRFLASALKMEEELADSVYPDYLGRSNWPANLPKNAFEEIRKRLTVLIAGARNHRSRIQGLLDRYDDGSK